MDAYATLVPGQIYDHTNGSQYLCKRIVYFSDAVLERVSDKWTLTAHGTRITEAGKIHWNYSTGGYWPQRQ